MLFAHDVVASMQAAVALVNTAAPPDTLTTLAQLEAFYAEHRYTGRRPTDLEAVRALREPLRELLTADRDTAVVIVNRMLTEHNAVPQLVRHGQEDYHLHAAGPEAPFATQIVVETASVRRRVLAAVLQHDVRQPGGGGGLPGAAGLTCRARE